MEDWVLWKHPTGSNYICNPPVIGTDIDFVVLAKPGWPNQIGPEWQQNYTTIEYDTMGDFTSVRNGPINYIVTINPDFFDKFVTATKIAKQQNLLNKADRIKLFQYIIYGNKI